MNDVVSVSAPTAEELRAELRARVVSLEAENARLRAEVEIAYKSRDEAVERANRLEFHDAQEQRGAAEAPTPPKPAPETGPSATDQAEGLVAMLLDLWPKLEDVMRRDFVDRLADGYCLGIRGCGCNNPRCSCENDDF